MSPTTTTTTPEEVRMASPRSGPKARATLTVFWEGTANTLVPPTTQIGLFFAATKATDVTQSEALPSSSAGSEEDEVQLKMAFDGCGVTNGTLGLLFAAGLRQQARDVARKVSAMTEAYAKPVRCNVLGLSRGGVAAIFLAQALTEMPASDVELNLLLFDPVPGDQTWSGFPYTGSFAKDVSSCECLKRVVALYPHEPLPDVTFHAPVLCVYPPDCEVEEDVILGCHQGALFATRRSPHVVHRASNISFRRIVTFFQTVGTPLDLARYFAYQPSDYDVILICRDALDRSEPTRRKLHDGLSRGRAIVRRTTGRFLNKFHERLERHMDPPTRGAGSDRLPAKDPYARVPKYMLDIDCPDLQRACFWVPQA